MDYGVTVALLRRMPLFAAMDSSSLKMLAFSSIYLQLERGDTLCVEGDAPDGVYIIDEGEAEVVVHDGGLHSRIAVVGRHQVVGEIGVILNQPRSATVRAIGPLTALKIDAEVFLELVTGEPTAARSVLRTLCERLAQMVKKYEELSGRLDGSV